MKKSLILVLVLMSAVQLFAQGRQFVHPGLSHKKSDIDRMRAMVNAQIDPWYGSFVRLSNDNNAKFTYSVRGNASITTIRPSGDNTYSAISSDARAAYLNALMWVLTDDVRHAQKAVEIFNAWKNVTCFEAGGTESLNVGRVGWLLVEAAELIKHTYDGWAPSDMQQFKDMLVHPGYSNTHVPANIVSEGTFYWRAYMGDPGRHGNQDLFGWRLVMSMGVFLDNEIMYDRALRYFSNQTSRPDDLNYAGGPPRTSATPTATNEYFNTYTLYSRDNTTADYGYNGVLPYFIWENGQCQESSRDQDHAILGLGLIAAIAEIAWNQGDDVYSSYDNRILKGYEWALRYNVSMSYSFPDQPGPWEPRVETGEFIQRRDRSGRWYSLKPNPYYESDFTRFSRGNFRSDKRPVYEIALAHYGVRVGLDEQSMLWTSRALEISNNEVGYESSGWSLDHSGWGGLTFHRNPWMAGDPVRFPAGNPVFEMPRVPCEIKAVDYDFFAGDGQYRTYFDRSAEDEGKVYRRDGVDITTGDHSFVVTSMETGEWLSYTFQVPVDGEYRLLVRHRTTGTGARLKAVIDNEQEMEASLPVKAEFGPTALGDLRLTKGAKVLRIYVAGEGNVSELSSVQLIQNPEAVKKMELAAVLNDKNHAVLSWSLENIIPSSVEIFRGVGDDFEKASAIASVSLDAVSYTDASVSGKVPGYHYWLVCNENDVQRVSETASVSWGAIFDDFKDTQQARWSVVNGTGSVDGGVLNIGYNSSGKAYVSRMGGYTLHAGNFPVLACKIETPPGTIIAVHNAVSSLLGGGNDAQNGVIGNSVVYYDLTKVGFTSSSATVMVPADDILTGSFFQLRLTSSDTATPSRLHWVRTFKSIEELNEYVISGISEIPDQFTLWYLQEGNMISFPSVNESVLITVYDSAGQRITTVRTENMSPEVYLPDPGIYIIHVAGVHFKQAIKVII